MTKMQKKKNVMVVIALVIIAMLLIILPLVFLQKPKKEGNEYFNLEPETWIEDLPNTDEAKDKEINVFKATRGKATLDGYQEDYAVGNDIISLFYSGLYNGNYFRNVFIDYEFYNVSEGKTKEENKQLVNEYIKMKIGKSLNPSDGAIDSFILGKEEYGKFVFYIFLDEDWKQQLRFTNILWGDDFLDKKTLHIKKFDFSKSKEGIYIDKVGEDVDWFLDSPIKGGIIIGEVDFNTLDRISNYEITDETMIMVR